MKKHHLIQFLQGLALGSANVIPGVSGGTMALLFGIFERLINAIKSFNLTALQWLGQREWRKFAQHTDFVFLMSLLFGIVAAILSLAELLDFLFQRYPEWVWSFFLGLILASVYFVGRRIEHWRPPVFIMLIAGAALALFISFVNPATENDGFFYLILCGAVSMCSMILPGLSGSFVLVLMGNYQLVMIHAVSQRDFTILLPVALGAGLGLVLFANLIAWIFKHFRNATLGLLTGFIFGSVGVLWPWKNTLYLRDAAGELIIKEGEAVITGYRPFFPDVFTSEFAVALLLMVVGAGLIILIERSAPEKES
ncbi:MAG: DUF368 domain-containing protein [candidate division KSB1 bacterium]|nr:DUF368 domain-containing protein [candidate division KSB1 bacterium]